VSSTLTPPASPTVSGTYLDTDQSLTVSGALSSTGTSPYAWAWLISINGGSEGLATQCAINSGTGGAPSASETCAIAGGVLAAGTTYSFELSVTDSASNPETSPSTASATVFAAAPLTAAAIAPFSPTLDAGQSVTLTAGRTGGIAPFSFQWYLGASCTGPIAGAVSSTYLAAPASTTSYYYAVVDSASTPESACSAGDTVGVNPALTAPPAPTISDAYLDADQAMTVSGAIPSTGTGPYAWAWLLPLSSGAVVLATQCTVSSGKGAVAGAVETCAIPGGALTAGSTYNFELTVNDSAWVSETQTSTASPTVSVAPALVAGPIGPASPSLDSGQSVTLSATYSGGTATYTYQWFTGTGCATPIAGATKITYSAAPTSSTTYTYQVADSATTPEAACSPGDLVSVNSPLGVPSAPTVSGTLVDADLSLTAMGTIPSSGTAPFSWEWLASVGGGPFAPATHCVVNSGIQASAGATVVCATPKNTLTVGSTIAFELVVVDSSFAPARSTSPASPTVTVNAPPAVSAPLATPTSVDVGGAVVFTTTATGGSGAYPSYVWLESDVHFGCQSSSSGSITCVPTAPGVYTVSVNVTDSLGGTSSEATSVPLEVYGLPTVSTPVTSVSEAYVGQKVTYSTSASGGTGTYPTFRWAESSPSLRCNSTNLPVLACFPNASGSYTVWVSVVDSNGGASATAPSRPLTVTANLTVGTPVVTPSVVDLGTPVNITAIVNGGLGTIVYAWTGLPAGCAPIEASFSCTPAQAGAFNISLTVRDQSGVSASSGVARFVVNPVLTATASVSPPSAKVHALFAFSAVWTGGSAPFTVVWRFGDGASSTAASASHAYASGGSYLATLWVNDSLGTSTVRLVAVTVTAPPVQTNQVQLLGFAGSEAYILLAVIAVVLFVVLQVLFSVLNKKGGRSPPRSSTKDGSPKARTRKAPRPARGKPQTTGGKTASPEVERVDETAAGGGPSSPPISSPMPAREEPGEKLVEGGPSQVAPTVSMPAVVPSEATAPTEVPAPRLAPAPPTDVARSTTVVEVGNVAPSPPPSTPLSPSDGGVATPLATGPENPALPEVEPPAPEATGSPQTFLAGDEIIRPSVAAQPPLEGLISGLVSVPQPGPTSPPTPDDTPSGMDEQLSHLLEQWKAESPQDASLPPTPRKPPAEPAADEASGTERAPSEGGSSSSESHESTGSGPDPSQPDPRGTRR
ncbi:MAG: PKD domain-containing protein, partial [Thermoplasmata archaeon]|nr:PKD domain-containing protein [Thermoplasmata archaeon]